MDKIDKRKYVKYLNFNDSILTQKFNIDGITYEFPLVIKWMEKPLVWYKGTEPKLEKKGIRINRFEYGENYIWGSQEVIFYEDKSEPVSWDENHNYTRIYDLDDIKNMLKKQQEIPIPEEETFYV